MLATAKVVITAIYKYIKSTCCAPYTHRILSVNCISAMKKEEQDEGMDRAWKMTTSDTKTNWPKASR